MLRLACDWAHTGCRLGVSKMFSRKRQVYVDAKTMNEHLKYCYKYRQIVEREKAPGETFANKAFVEDKLVYFYLSYKKGSQACTYILRKDGNEDVQKIDGGEAFRILSQYYKVPVFEDKKILAMTSGPYTYSNPKYSGIRVKAIGYDMNSAYAYAMLKDMPDTTVAPHAGVIKKGEIGFMEVPKDDDPDQMRLVPKFTGYAYWVFPLMKSPFVEFVNTWYEKKKHKETKTKAKNVLNYSVGCIRKKNPFLYATILGYAGQLIRDLSDENTLLCNTDSIVSLVPRPDLKLGTELGEWKIEHEGEFAYIGSAYQWNKDLPSWKHVPKAWFKEGFDILTDELPANGNIYEYKNYEIKEVKYDC